MRVWLVILAFGLLPIVAADNSNSTVFKCQFKRQEPKMDKSQMKMFAGDQALKVGFLGYLEYAKNLYLPLELESVTLTPRQNGAGYMELDLDCGKIIMNYQTHHGVTHDTLVIDHLTSTFKPMTQVKFVCVFYDYKIVVNLRESPHEDELVIGCRDENMQESDSKIHMSALVMEYDPNKRASN